jgi:hypothetical protein
MPAFAQQTLPQGAVVKGNLTQPLSSKTANVGDGFTLVGVNSQDGSVTGATIYGHVAAVQRAGTGHPGQMQLAFDRIQFADGTSTDVRGQTISMSQKQQGTNPGVRDAIGAVGGMIVGNIIGKWIGTPTNVGGLAGAAGGFLVIAAELALEHTVHAAQLLLLAQLDAVIRQAVALGAVLAGGRFDAALGLERTHAALQEQIRTFAPRQLALGTEITSHVCITS